METPEDLVARHEALLPNVRKFVLEYISTLKFNKGNKQQLYAVCLYCRLIELSHAVEISLDGNAVVAVPIWFRSIFELDVDITNIIADSTYCAQLDLAFLLQKKRLLEATRKPNSENAYLKPIKEIRDVQSDYGEVTKEINDLKANGFTDMVIRQRAEKADKLDEYDSVYNLLCLSAHNNISEVINAHIDQESAGEAKVVIFCQKIEDYLGHISAVIGILLQKTQTIGEFLGGQSIADEECVREFTRLKDEVSAEGKRQIDLHAQQLGGKQSPST
jgi:hypothetical protein